MAETSPANKPATGLDFAARPQRELDVMSAELSSRRTGLSFQRTRTSADRTLMSIMRTSLSLIGFGFTLFQFFRYLRQSVGTHVPVQAARNFGMALVIFGVLLLLLGLWAHVKFMRELRAERALLVAERYVHGEESFPYSITLLIATLLLLLGLVAIIDMAFRSGPLS
jgi:putative membrane protein